MNYSQHFTILQSTSQNIYPKIRTENKAKKCTDSVGRLLKVNLCNIKAKLQSVKALWFSVWSQNHRIDRWCRLSLCLYHVSSVCLVWGSRRATSPPASRSADTISRGTAQLESTSCPNTTFPMMAATRPAPVNTPRADELQKRNGN